MKAILPVLLAASASTGLVLYGAKTPENPAPAEPSAPLRKVAEPLEGKPSEWAFATLQPGGPPAPLPATVNCTVVVGGTTTGTFPLQWDGVGWSGLVTVPGAGTKPVFLNMGFTPPVGYTPNLFWAHVSPFGQATHNPSGAHYCGAGSVAPLNIRADMTASTLPAPHVAYRVVFVFTG